MATTTFIPVEQYLATSYRPDCDYVDGEVQERNLGERFHASVQAMITIIFGQHRRDWHLIPLTEQRVQVSATRFRVPDVCVVRDTDPLTRILEFAPVLCIEILSPEDRFSRILERVEEYLDMGVPEVWIIDPRTRDIWTVGQGGRPVLVRESELTLRDLPVHVEAHEIFALIDQAGGTLQQT